MLAVVVSDKESLDRESLGSLGGGGGFINIDWGWSSCWRVKWCKKEARFFSCCFSQTDICILIRRDFTRVEESPPELQLLKMELGPTDVMQRRGALTLRSHFARYGRPTLVYRW